MGPYQVLSLQAIVDLRVMATKGYSAFPRAPAGISPSDCLVSYPEHTLGSFTPLQRCSRYILQPQPTGLDVLVSYPGHLFGGYLSAEMPSVYSTALADLAMLAVRDLKNV